MWARGEDLMQADANDEEMLRALRAHGRLAHK